jgi:arginine decarboxylase-like protein
VGSRQVRVLDLGGGLPVDYASDAPDAAVPERLTMARYAHALREKVPEPVSRRRSPRPY